MEQELLTLKGKPVTATVAFRLELGPYMELQRRAQAEGLSVSEWMRRNTRQVLQAQKGAEHEHRD